MSKYRCRRPFHRDLAPAKSVFSCLWRAWRRVLTYASADHRRVELFYRLRRDQGGRLPSPACQATHFAKSSRDMWIVPAGPRIRGLSPFGPLKIALGLPSTIKWPRGASTFPRLACGPKPALFNPIGPKIRSSINSSQVFLPIRSRIAPAMT